ncbi:hypothetical protein JMJ77_0012930 [Colletotrichum scovillei]|uniref:Uncharacterized protein n=1 Tax=Colletotrichum scovillei TaxID=1209932 RepID=A0A9P7UC82_9PEZI|nr:hypothetical protein JMJ77_0012930 [Colletotrichum scovillei]KAG7073170.1 hypothetical protein JMJ78_0014149 [Colletotrichum scovillei]
MKEPPKPSTEPVESKKETAEQLLCLLAVNFSSRVVLAVLGSEHCTIDSGELFVIYGVAAMIAFPVSCIAILEHWPKGPRGTSGLMTAGILGYSIAMAHSFVTGPWPTIFTRHSYHFSGVYIGFLIEVATGWCDGVASIMAEKFSK